MRGNDSAVPAMFPFSLFSYLSTFRHPLAPRAPLAPHANLQDTYRASLGHLSHISQISHISHMPRPPATLLHSPRISATPATQGALTLASSQRQSCLPWRLQQGLSTLRNIQESDMVKRSPHFAFPKKMISNGGSNIPVSSSK